MFQHLVQDVFVEVRHITLTGNRTIVVISEVLLQSNWIVWDTQDCAQVVGQHLENHDILYLADTLRKKGSFSSLGKLKLSSVWLV